MKKPRKRNKHPDLPEGIYPDKVRGKPVHVLRYHPQSDYRKVYIWETKGSPEWFARLAVLLAFPKEHYLKKPKGDAQEIAAVPEAARVVPNSHKAICLRVMRATEQWEALSKGTQDTYRGHAEWTFREREDPDDPSSRVCADFPVGEMTVEEDGFLSVLYGRRKKKSRKSADNLRKALQFIYGVAFAEGWVPEDFSRNLRKLSKKLARKLAKAKRRDADDDDEENAHTWTHAEVEKWRQRYPVGTRERLVLELGVRLGLARADIRIVGWKNFSVENRDGRQVRIFRYRRQKTGVLGVIEVPPELWNIITKTKLIGATTFIITTKGPRKGQPFKDAESLGNQIGVWRDRAGLPKQCGSHGWRRRFATDWAERGVTAAQLQTLGAWATLQEAQKYIDAVDRVRMAMKAAGLRE